MAAESPATITAPAHHSRRPVLFEVAWEVCKKMGGIYTVMKSKAPSTVEDWGDRYCLIGPYDQKAAAGEFESLPPGPVLQPVIESLQKNYGMVLHFGRWLIPGNPRVILIDINTQQHRLNDFKGDMWRDLKLSMPNGDDETDQTLLFGFQVYWFFKELTTLNTSRAVIVQFHEWLAGVGLPLLRFNRIPVATLFTTHATLLGRYVCAGGGKDFYSRLATLDVDKEAGDRGIFHRHAIEKAAAHAAHVFTTVSQITALECEHIHKRKCDFVLPNGLAIERFEALHELQVLHASNKAVIHEFVRGHFHGFYDFNLENTLYFFTAGRYEHFNKGFDMFIESLARLNYRLRQNPNNETTVVAFIITKAQTDSYNVSSLKGQSLIRELRQACDVINGKMETRLFESLARGELPDVKKLITEEEMVECKRRILSLKRNQLPPVTTHKLMDDANDPVLKQLRSVQLFNRPEDRVKIIYHPDFLSSTSALLALDYEPFVRGCHLGVFPSYYEPWGYTPAECTVMGVPSVTSNLSGFANYIEERMENCEESGLFIIDRKPPKSFEDSAEDLTRVLERFCYLSRRERITMRNNTERASALLDWHTLGHAYEEAREEALLRYYAPK